MCVNIFYFSNFKATLSLPGFHNFIKNCVLFTKKEPIKPLFLNFLLNEKL